ncbi:MAG: ABC transporter substrate-binding protein [Lachnospiraceae bacterium]|nr:ABC transporter substrate-binding protein [Lachnospiraceae bacterium]
MLKKTIKKSLILAASLVILGGCSYVDTVNGPADTPDEKNEDMEKPEKTVAEAEDMAEAVILDTEGLKPVYSESLNEGEYDIEVDSSSSMFRITKARLKVSQGKMTVTMTMGGKGYLYLYPGTGEEASKADKESYIAFLEDEEGNHTFTVPIEALDREEAFAAFSKKKELWYDRILVFRSDSLDQEAFKKGVLKTPEELGLEDGEYSVEVSLKGGSGKASITSPTELFVSEGRCFAKIEWSSKNYDYMIVEGEKLYNENEGGNSLFTIPVSYFDKEMKVTADTLAMSKAHEIDYSLLFLSDTIKEGGTLENVGALSPTKEAEDEKKINKAQDSLIKYSEKFDMLRTKEGNFYVDIFDDKSILILKKDNKEDGDIKADITIREGEGDIYLASSSVMDFFRELSNLSLVSMTSTRSEDWSMPKVAEMVDKGDIKYVGKYSAPDYELLISNGCKLAVENTMIYHNPEVKENLEKLGIDVLVERSSYERAPLGRLEWIKLYGALTGSYEKAEAFFEKSVEELSDIKNTVSKKKKVICFSVNEKGIVNIKLPNDYLSALIEMAGGDNPFKELVDEDSDKTGMNIEMESFFEEAKDADILIYNSTIEGEIDTLKELYDRGEIFKEMKACKEGRVYCMVNDVFQQPTIMTKLVKDFSLIMDEKDIKEGDKLNYLRKLSS